MRKKSRQTKEVVTSRKKQRSKKKPKASIEKISKQREKKEKIKLYKTAYPLTFNSFNQLKTILLYLAIFGGFILLLTGYTSFTIAGALFAVFYATQVVIPYELRSEYESHSLQARNRFVNTLTQIMTSPNRTTLEALAIGIERVEGELKADLRNLLANLGSANASETQQLFRDLGKKYENDIIFTQYLDQLTTALVEGRGNIETLKDLKTYHNDMKKKQEYYTRQKKKSAQEVYVMFAFIAGFVAMLGFAFGRDQYISVYAQQPIGWICNGIFLIMEGSLYRSFYNYYRDNEILEV